MAVFRIVKLVKKIREDDAETKKRWLIIFSAVLMSIVVVVWLSFFNAVSYQTGFADRQAAGEEKPSHLAIFSRGLKITWQKIKSDAASYTADAYRSVLSKIGRSTTVRKEEPDFILEDLDLIPPTSLP